VGAYVIKGTARLLGLSSIWDSIFRSIGLLVLPHHPFFSQNLVIVLTRSDLVRLRKFLIPQPSHTLLFLLHLYSILSVVLKLLVLGFVLIVVKSTCVTLVCCCQTQLLLDWTSLNKRYSGLRHLLPRI
jgi:hypothetical protein